LSRRPPGNFTIRAATAEDASAIRSLIRRVRINPQGLDWHHFVLAVDASGSMIACGQLKPHGHGITELASIAVEDNHRRRGAARAIIDHLLERAPRPLYLTCRSTLGPFYEQWGFVEVPYVDLPGYYRRLLRLVSLITPFFAPGQRLLVMVLK
jgi:N-acetylglutamate synthase-like GNAT family acetyltransferase